MYELNIKLAPKDILEKEFKVDAKGYRPQEVDAFLDTVINDYTEFIRFIKKVGQENTDIKEENTRLKNELYKLKMEFETASSLDASSSKYTSSNVDILKRLSNLEKIVYENEKNDND